MQEPNNQVSLACTHAIITHSSSVKNENNNPVHKTGALKAKLDVTTSLGVTWKKCDRFKA